MKKILLLAFVSLIASFLYQAYGKGKATTLPDETQRFGMEEVEKHRSESDCWIVIEEKVYNITSFIPTHPGGEAILAGCGKDATSMFNRRPGVNTPHSEGARELMKEFYIGELK